MGEKKGHRHPSQKCKNTVIELYRFFFSIFCVFPQNPLCATEGIGDEKGRFLGFRTFASREKGLHTPLFPKRLRPGSPRVGHGNIDESVQESARSAPTADAPSGEQARRPLASGDAFRATPRENSRGL